MNKLWHNLFCLALCAIFCDYANALDLRGDINTSGNFPLNEDTMVYSGVVLSAHDILVQNNLLLYNMGTIDGRVNVSGTYTLELMNSGTLYADVVLQNGAHLVQVISSNETATEIGSVSNYRVSVRDGRALDLRRIMGVTQNADRVEFVNTTFNAGSVSTFVAPNGINLCGDILLTFNDVPDGQMLLFSGATGDAVISVDSLQSDVLYAFQTYWVDDNVFVHMVRSTDYARIMNNDMGRFLNNLRAGGDDNKLFSKLDSAKSLAEINDVLSKSVRITPIKLMRPLEIMYSHKSLEIMHIDDETTFGIEPFAIYSSDLHMAGIRPNVKMKISDDWHLELSGVVAGAAHSDDINEFDTMSFGVWADVQYNITDKDFVRAHIGGDKTMFNVGPIFDGAGTVNDPDGISAFIIGEVGHRFDFDDGYNISPFVLVGGEYMSVANANDKNMFAGGGAEFGYEYEFDGLRYNYALRAIARTDSVIGAGINISVWSIFDDAGANVHIDAIHDNDFGMSYKLSINGIFRF